MWLNDWSQFPRSKRALVGWGGGKDKQSKRKCKSPFMPINTFEIKSVKPSQEPVLLRVQLLCQASMASHGMGLSDTLCTWPASPTKRQKYNFKKIGLKWRSVSMAVDVPVSWPV